MPKYLVRYQSVEYYEKEYEAPSSALAEQAYYDDERLWDVSPYDSDTELIEIEEINA